MLLLHSFVAGCNTDWTLDISRVDLLRYFFKIWYKRKWCSSWLQHLQLTGAWCFVFTLSYYMDKFKKLYFSCCAFLYLHHYHCHRLYRARDLYHYEPRQLLARTDLLGNSKWWSFWGRMGRHKRLQQNTHCHSFCLIWSMASYLPSDQSHFHSDTSCLQIGL